MDMDDANFPLLIGILFMLLLIHIESAFDYRKLKEIEASLEVIAAQQEGCR